MYVFDNVTFIEIKFRIAEWPLKCSNYIR
uniref:Uncharacterized protein n=1 Tax=mine drainage metagenome TaxID=410659 RepID=E6QHS2_9ZZZZ